MQIITDERCTEYVQQGHPERPERISLTLERLRGQQELPIKWAAPSAVTDDHLLRAHSREHLNLLREPASAFDADTPAYAKINEHARRGVGGALAALASGRAGQPALSLFRPPGHHATRDRMMGFCYLNSIAVAVLEALATGARRVAVFDFDVHHGNGTEAILLNQPHCAFFSVHQHPAYPGTGAQSTGNCHNYPVAPGAPRATYLKALALAFKEIAAYGPDLLAVSAGFDAYRKDPLSDAALEIEDYRWLGDSIRKTGVPSFSVLEGGYSDALPDLIFAYCQGLNG
jgi:acetoin utilization deacetylase AcuC-like enzyme